MCRGACKHSHTRVTAGDVFDNDASSEALKQMFGLSVKDEEEMSPPKVVYDGSDDDDLEDSDDDDLEESDDVSATHQKDTEASEGGEAGSDR